MLVSQSWESRPRTFADFPFGHVPTRSQLCLMLGEARSGRTVPLRAHLLSLRRVCNQYVGYTCERLHGTPGGSHMETPATHMPHHAGYSPSFRHCSESAYSGTKCSLPSKALIAIASRLARTDIPTAPPVLWARVRAEGRRGATRNDLHVRTLCLRHRAGTKLAAQLFLRKYVSLRVAVWRARLRACRRKSRPRVASGLRGSCADCESAPACRGSRSCSYSTATRRRCLESSPASRASLPLRPGCSSGSTGSTTPQSRSASLSWCARPGSGRRLRQSRHTCAPTSPSKLKRSRS